MSENARLILPATAQHPGGREIELPFGVGAENEEYVDIDRLRTTSGGVITLDDGYRNTGSCQSGITFIDGEKGILRYRGTPIEKLAQQSTFVETAMLLMFGELPNADRLGSFRRLLAQHEIIHEGMRHSFQGFPAINKKFCASVVSLCFRGSTHRPGLFISVF